MGCGCNEPKPPPVEESLTATPVDAAVEVKATASVEEEVKKDLEVDDPTSEKTEAQLRGVESHTL